jgi:hypothetical protein
LPALSPEARRHRARLGGLKRSGVPDDDPRYDEARRDLRAQVLTDYVQRTLAGRPPLTAEQRSKLAEFASRFASALSAYGPSTSRCLRAVGVRQRHPSHMEPAYTNCRDWRDWRE